MNDQSMPVNMSLAMAYVPWQPWDNLYNECVALERGTAFPSLDLPFLAKEASAWSR